MPDFAAGSEMDVVSLGLSLGRPALTLSEAGALLGISDRAAMVTERSALTRLLRIFRDLGLKDINSFLMADESLIDAVAAQHASYAEEYSQSRGWFPITPQPETTLGLELLRTAVLNHAAARAHDKRVPRVPILWQPADHSDRSLFGYAEAVAFVNGGAVFRSTNLANTVSPATAPPHAAAVIDNRFHNSTGDTDARTRSELVAITVTPP
jgi:hypothetical protein